MRRLSAVAISMALVVSLSDSLAVRAQGPGAPGAAAAPTVPQAPARNPNEGADFGPRAPIPARTPEDEAKAFYLPPGYRMELVAAEPDVISPAVIEFDGNGRMYVIEFLSYMLDADGTGAHDPISRITRFESTKGDGRFDKRTVFADKLILPRMILPLEDGVILTNETDSDDVIRLTDTNGDGVADKKEVVYSGVGTNRTDSSGASTTGSTAPTTPSGFAGRPVVSCASQPATTARSGACRRTMMARSGGHVAGASAATSTFSSRFITARSPGPNRRSPTSTPCTRLPACPTRREAWVACACRWAC
jgi:hypothetical protein